MLISKATANLIGGVSQQAPPLRLPNQGQEQVNMQSSLVNGLQNRAPLVMQQTGGMSNAGFYRSDRDYQHKYNVLVSPYAIKVSSINGEWVDVELSQEALAYLKLPKDADPTQSYKTLTLADYTFVLNTTKVAQMSSEKSPAQLNRALVFIKQVNYGSTWVVTIDDTKRSCGYSEPSTSDNSYTLYVNGTQKTAGTTLSTDVIARELAAFNLPDFEITQNGPVLLIQRKDGGPFKIGVSDSRANSMINLVTSKIQNFSDLPTVAPNGYICHVMGEIASDADDYYVKFVTNAGDDFGKGTWEETCAPDSNISLDSNTMPWTLIHNADDTWTFKAFEWDKKDNGDEETNATPSFVGRKILNMLYFRTRLCFLAQEYFCMGRAGEVGNWWNATAFTVSDSDPIYIDVSTDSVVELYDFGILQDNLILFSENGQFVLNSPEVLSPKTASVTQLSTSAYTVGTGVVSCGTRLFFGYQAGGYYNTVEFGLNALTSQKEATPITSHVPNYIPGKRMNYINGSDNASALAVISRDKPDTLYVYQYYVMGTQKLQSAWHRYTFGGANIQGAFFRDHVLWLYLSQGGVYYTATLDMSEHMLTPGSQACLDFATTLTATEAITDWELPLYLSPTNCVVLRKVSDNLYAQEPIESFEVRTIKLRNAATEILVGQPYLRHYEFSTQYPMKNSNGSSIAITTGRWGLQRMVLNYGNIGPFSIFVKPSYDQNAVGWQYDYNGVTVGAENGILNTMPSNSGGFKIPLHGRNTDLRVIIETDSWLPQSWISAEWVGLFVTKERQV